MSCVEDEPPPVLLPCSICSRTFRPDVLERHRKVCEKTASKKRKVFDSFKSRVTGTELEEFLGPAPLPGQISKRPDKSPLKKSQGRPKWKETHENLIAVLRAARGAALADPAVILAPKNSGNEQCPSCGRFFGPRAFDRHAQFCKEKTSRIKLTPSKVSQAQERLEARTKYKAPLSLKPKITTKEKYSPMPSRKVESSETNLLSSHGKTPILSSLNKTAKTLSGKSNLSNFSRQSPTRASERQRSTSPRKPLVSNSRVTKDSYAKHSTQPKIKDTLTETEVLRPKQITKMSSHQNKIRSSNRNLSDLEDELRSNRKYYASEKSKQRSNMSSDDGNETDSLNSLNMCCNVRRQTKNSKGIACCNLGKKMESVVKEGVPKISHDEASKSSRKNKTRLALINDLSVNDESFGIHVAPCPHQSLVQRKKSANHKKVVSRASTPKMEEIEELEKPTKITVEVTIPGVTQIRSSRIPKPVTKAGDVRKEDVMNDAEEPDKTSEDDLKKDRERTAVIKKDNFKKWCDVSALSTAELINISDELDFVSHLNDSQMKNALETEDGEIEEISQSTTWDLSAEEFLNFDDSVECKTDISDTAPNEIKEDEFIVLHFAERQKLTDDDMHMKLCISEPCFKTNYIDGDAMLKCLKANPDVIVFDSSPKYARKKPLYRQRKVQTSKKVKIIPRFLAIREKTFLANDSPRIKKPKLSGKDEELLPKISNITDYYFGHVSAVRKEYRNFSPNIKGLEESISEYGKVGKSISKARCKSNTMTSSPEEVQEKVVEKKYDYFEIHKEMGDCESSVVSEKEYPESTPKLNDMENNLEKVRKNSGMKNNLRTPTPRSDEVLEKFTICYSDEEFEELRQKKEKCINQYQPRDTSIPYNDNPDDEPPSECLRPDHNQVFDSDEIDLLPIDSLEVLSVSKKFVQKEEQPVSGIRSIEIEDFIIRKPNKSSIMSKNLEDLFPKPPEVVNLKETESTTAVPLRYVLDSLYDLKSEENLQRGRLHAEKGIRLPEIEALSKKKEKKENSMSSLVQIWKTRKELIEKGKLYESQKAALAKTKRPKHKNPFQIALLPLVLTQKLAEVAEKLDNSLSKDESYDPFKQAERQMMALLSWPSTADLKSASDHPESMKNPNRTANLETSPTSAFTKYPSKDEQSPKELKENVNQKKVSSARSSKRNEEYTPVFNAADDWEEIFEKHFDLNRNEMNDKMTRSVKSALDGLLKSSPKKYSSEVENSPPQKNLSGLSESSVIEEITYTSTPKKSGSRLSNVSDSSFEKISDRKISSANRKDTNPSYARVTPPDEFSDSVGRDDWGRKSNRNSGVSLSSLSFCSQASDTTLADEEIMRTNLEIIGVGKSTPRTNKRRFARSQSVFDERNKMLFAKTFDTHFSSSDENEILPTINDLQGKKSVSSHPYPKPVPSRFPRSQSVMDGRCKGEGDHFEERDLVSSPEGNKNRKAKMSGDSAYSSLNRRSPRSGIQSNQQEDRLSSSGSEHSLPPLSNDHALKPVSLNFENTPSSVPSKKEQPYKMSKFCHECGSKYPVAVAKFCCECGVRRLII